MQPALERGTATTPRLPACDQAATNRFAPDRLLLDDAGAAHGRRQRLHQLDRRPARVGRVHDPRRPAPLRPHARPLGPRHGRATAATASTATTRPTLDRIMFVTGLKSMDLYFGGAWDFPSTGPTSATPYDVYGGQPYNTCNLCNVNEWVRVRRPPHEPRAAAAQALARRLRPQRRHLRGLPFQYSGRSPRQHRDAARRRTAINNGARAAQGVGAHPDLWVQALWRKFRFEAEAATIHGQIGYARRA